VALILADDPTRSVASWRRAGRRQLATLSGRGPVALAHLRAAVLANDDEWAERILAAGERTGELAWRLPLHPEYKELTRGSDADLTNSSSKRKASTIYAAEFLRSSRTACPGHTSTSQVRRGTSAAPTSATGPPGSACGSW